MKFNRSTLLGLASLTLLGATIAHAAVGQLSCTSNTSTINANLSFYDLGLSNTLNIGSQSSGAGAGKVTFNPLEIHTAVISCTLTAKTNGEAVEYKFSLVAISSLDAIARSPRTAEDKPASYLDVKLIFGAVEVKTSAGTDDGGSSGGWNVVKNKNK
jgi:hypothetical protein